MEPLWQPPITSCSALRETGAETCFRGWQVVDRNDDGQYRVPRLRPDGMAMQSGEIEPELKTSGCFTVVKHVKPQERLDLAIGHGEDGGRAPSWL